MADETKNFTKHGSLISRTSSRSVVWSLKNFPVICEERKKIRSDFFKVSAFTSCLFYLALELKENGNSFTIYVNRYFRNNFSNKFSYFKATITVSFEDILSNLHLTKCFDMTTDAPYVSTSYERDRIRNLCIEENLNICCSITLNDTEIRDSQKCFAWAENKVWSHCSVISSNELKEHIAVLLEDEAANKVIISVDGEIFPVHKNMLCSQSPVFSAMFEHDTLENQQNCVRVSDIRKEVIGEMLKFIYTGCTSALTPVMNMELFIAADKYAISSLKVRCSKFLASSLNQDLVLDILILAHQHADDNLKNAAIQYLTEKSPNLLESEEFISFIENEPEIAQHIVLFLVKHSAK